MADNNGIPQYEFLAQQEKQMRVANRSAGQAGGDAIRATKTWINERGERVVRHKQRLSERTRFPATNSNADRSTLASVSAISERGLACAASSSSCASAGTASPQARNQPQ
jgi:hypothetical protein